MFCDISAVQSHGLEKQRDYTCAFISMDLCLDYCNMLRAMDGAGKVHQPVAEMALTNQILQT